MGSSTPRGSRAPRLPVGWCLMKGCGGTSSPRKQCLDGYLRVAWVEGTAVARSGWWRVFVDWPGPAQPRQCGGAGSGVLVGALTATDDGDRLLCRWSLAHRGRFQTVSAGRHKTAIKPSGIDQTVPKKIKSCDPNLVFSQQTCDHSRELLFIS